MPIWTKNADRSHRVLLWLFERFSMHCLANVVEPLRAANTIARRQVFDWRFVTLDGAGVTSSSGLPVLPHSSLAEADRADVLFIMPSYDARAHATPRCLSALREAAGRHGAIAGMDMGSWLMARAGLLKGRRATIHWDEIDAFAETFPEVEVEHRRYVIDGTLMSSGGAMTAFDLTTRLVGDLLGEGMRLEVSALFMSADVERPEEPLRRRPRGRLVESAIALMRKHVEDPLPLPEVARKLGVGLRELESRFAAELGAGPRSVYRSLRLSAARRYVEQSTYPVSEIALRCGYRDASAMTRAFSAEFGVTPRDLRQGRGA
ncbi:helix-turn-helix domain-containing protein [Defluviimonas sp. WL0002]|uniref:Helix-turn-helix domain-containing protein n=1 Tax=Albidovulum marisflavi TaxID=2984159 RepID=A0ABT2Z945_9RHOB|nr:helix-turn-helix domain-containing protein [Defluviimonas sp. WL0002]MCV2867535.1 helix-turn-helix domain-containing protein [Defluviimonas sp. WL0002]